MAKAKRAPAKPVPSFDWAKLDEFIEGSKLSNYTARPPEGSISTMEYAAHYKMPRGQALKQLHKLRQLGKVECAGKFYTRMTGPSGLPFTQMMFYWVIVGDGKRA